MKQTTRCCLRTMLFAGMLLLTNYPGFSQTSSSTARCHVTAAPFQVRAEGLAERLGDIILQCSGSNPGAVFSGNFTLYLPVTVTNRVDAGNLTRDAELAVDLGIGFLPTGIAGQVSGNTISFNGISYTAPPSGNVNLRISNIRAAMNQLGYTSGGSAPVTASLSSSLAIDQSQVVLAYSQAGMLSNMSDAGISCYGSSIPETIDLPNLFAAGTIFASTRVTEGFASAFEARAGLADAGTRFVVKFSDFPSTARLFLPDAVAGSTALQPTSGGDLNLPQAVGRYVPGSGTLLLVRVTGADGSGAGGFGVTAPQGTGPVILAGVSEVSLTNGAGFAVYEVVDSNSSARESAQFPVFISLPRYTAPAVARETVALAPVSAIATASAIAPIPRFAAVAMLSDCAQLGDCKAPVVVPPKLFLEAIPLIFTAVSGGAMTSPSGSFHVHNNGKGSMDWTTQIIYTKGADWLVLDKTSGTNEGSVKVSVDPKKLAEGVYYSTIIVSAGAAGANSIAVSLAVKAAPPTPPPPPPVTPAVVVSQVLNAATLQAAPLVPGSLATLMGSHLTGKSVAVTLDGAAGTVLFSSDSQINLQVPGSLGSKTSASLVVTVDGVSSTPMAVPVAAAWPAVFAHGVLNQDNRENTAGAAAKAGEILQIYATGIPKLATVSVQMGERRELVPVYAGEAPTVPGVQQVNVAVPVGVAGPVSLQICATVSGQQTCSPAYPIAVE